MLVLKEILAWTETNLTPWQRDAVRRLFENQKLNDGDFDDLYAMLKSAHGLPDSKKRQPVPLPYENPPSKAQHTQRVILKRVHDLINVNKIAPGQSLDFGEALTVVYGPNASGKSGYSRVLKQACRARDGAEKVLPDATNSGTVQATPEATFDVEVDGQSKSLSWKQGSSPPPELSSIAVFDSRCARSYLAEGEAAYLPYGLDIVENLARRVFPELARRLDEEIASVNTDTGAFSDLPAETAIGKMIAQLNENTDTRQLRQLAILTEEEQVRLIQIEGILKEGDPAATARMLRRLEMRFNELVTRIDHAVRQIDNGTVDKLKILDGQTESAARAETIAAGGLSGDQSLLHGTGGKEWRALFEAARRFSAEVAYPHHKFPKIGTGACCPLCQQVLDEASSERLRRFDEYVKQEAAETAAERRAAREESLKQIQGNSLDFGLDRATAAEIKESDSALYEAIRAFQVQVEATRKWITNALQTHCWNEAPTLINDPRDALSEHAKKFAIQAKALEEASDPAKKKAAVAELLELQSRASLSSRVGPLLAIVGRMQNKAKLGRCRLALNTRAISEKAKDLASKATTAALSSALNDEFSKLGIQHIKTKLLSRTQQGRTLYRLVLDLPIATKLDEILSEGEQRSIAIGSFLAELHLANHKGGIVFDDPVSSLDHHNRKSVAIRLVEEAKQRQVIVFTHDTTFLGELREAIEEHGVKHLISHLEWAVNHPGRVAEGLPWGHKSYKERLEKLGQEQRLLARNWTTYPNEQQCMKMGELYSQLRATIERAVQDVIFNGVIVRYRNYVNLKNLGGVVGFTRTECDEVSRLVKACHDATIAHDAPSAKNSSAPDATQLGKDIAALAAVVDVIKDRRSPATGTHAAPTT